jgi:hypothetical protein
VVGINEKLQPELHIAAAREVCERAVANLRQIQV